MELKKAEQTIQQPHVVCVPYPGQGHINPMMQLVQLLHSTGIHITLVHSEFDHSRISKSRGSQHSPSTRPDGFRIETIPDGLPPNDREAMRHIPTLCDSIRKKACLAPFRELVMRLNDSADSSRVSCIVSDGVMTFTQEVAEELGIPNVVFWTTGACGLMAYIYCRELIKRGLAPLKDESYLNNGYLDTTIDWIPGMGEIRFEDMPSFIRSTDPNNDIMLNFMLDEAHNTFKAPAIVLNTFDELEYDVITAMRSMSSHVYTTGPLSMLCRHMPNYHQFKSMGWNLWKEDIGCLEWLDSQESASVIYVNFGSTTVVTAHHLSEFAWGLANSNHPFLWVIRSNLVVGDHAILQDDFMAEIKGRGLLVSWCPQEEVLSHPSIGGFITHCGWNSTIESICGGVPMICWPFFAEQMTNRRYICKEWGIGMEIDANVRREEIENAVKELMGRGEKGKEMMKNAMKWKERATKAIEEGGSSYTNFYRLVNEIFMPRDHRISTGSAANAGTAVG
ncbi:(R)-mandelonitrile beta-glucosyltransferase-like [Magnolia sinica]|uniref:(R)-mandelonitrile beta-glucosyltransferase-like n=1 Tax=Magnolia sinica TaxID=86752 RepID=UPI00265A261B|nr:(R)-mandelonitrile beta-glucosyltransferase-like [Magnolia sinica]